MVAIVDDDPSVCRALRRLVLALGHEARTFESGNVLVDFADPVSPSHILLDLHMPGLRGAALVARIRSRWPEARVLVMTGLETPGAAEACRAAGATGLQRKPIRSDDLRRFLSLDEA
jgi:FixJ family two-component response regulator